MHLPGVSAFFLTAAHKQAASADVDSASTLLLVTNAHHDLVLFTLPAVKGGRDWVRLLDTNLPDEDADSDFPARFRFGHKYGVTGRSLLLFALRHTRRISHQHSQ